jgi:hypothetical protein
MKQKQNGSAHIILLCILVVLIGGVLTYALLRTLDNTLNTEQVHQHSNQNAVSTKQSDSMNNQTHTEFSEWNVRFQSPTKYTLKRNSGTGNMAGYWISIDSLAQTCTTPDTPWLGFIGQYNPNDVVENGPEAGKTYSQMFEKQGKIINDKLYVFKITTGVCTRNESNPAIEDAAKKLESEIQDLEAY